jgi:mycoredoxin
MADIRLAAARRGMDANTHYVERTMTNASITMYSTQWCGYCHRLKTVFKSEGIAYDEVDIENDPAAAEFVGSVNNGNHVVPTVKFADGSTMTNPTAKEVKAKLAQLAG